MSPRWEKVYRDLWDNKSRTILIVSSITVGLIAFGAMFIGGANLQANLAANFHMSQPWDVRIDGAGFDDMTLRWLRRQDDVLAVETRGRHLLRLLNTPAGENVMLHVYEDYTDLTVGQLPLEAGRYPQERDEVAVERSYAAAWGIAVGDVISVEDTNERAYDLIVTGIVHDIDNFPEFISDNLQAYTTPRAIYRIGLPDTSNQSLIRVDRQAVPDLNVFTSDLTDDMLRRGMIVTGSESRQELEPLLYDNTQAVSQLLTIVGSTALVLSGFLIYNSISAFLSQQVRIIGVTKIIGGSRRQIITLYFVTVGVFGAMAMLIAIPSGIAIAHALANFVGPGQLNFKIIAFEVPLSFILMQIAVAIGIPLLSAAGPILNGTRMSAAQALSANGQQEGNDLVGALLARLGGLPTPFLISLRNTFRNKVRLGMTIVTLIIAGALFVAVFNLRSGIAVDAARTVNFADAEVTIRHNRMSDESRDLERRVGQLPGVTLTETWVQIRTARELSPGVNSSDVPFFGIPADSATVQPIMVEGRWLNETRTAENRYDLVLNYAYWDEEDNIRVGDRITLETNGETQDWYVVGITHDVPGTAIYGYAETVKDFAATANVPMTHLMRVVSPTAVSISEQEALALEIETLLEDKDISVQSKVSNLDAIAGDIDALTVVIALLLLTGAMIAIVGGLGLSGTMTLSVMERTREIGVMRSVGASSATLRLMFIGEGLIVGMLSYIGALLLANPMTTALSMILGQTIQNRPYAYVFNTAGALTWLSIVLILAIASSVLPAQRAAQISIREAISFE
ncbi:MAG: ABC transporter permease [Chloroflexota bacterium]